MKGFETGSLRAYTNMLVYGRKMPETPCAVKGLERMGRNGETRKRLHAGKEGAHMES